MIGPQIDEACFHASLQFLLTTAQDLKGLTSLPQRLEECKRGSVSGANKGSAIGTYIKTHEEDVSSNLGLAIAICLTARRKGRLWGILHLLDR